MADWYVERADSMRAGGVDLDQDEFDAELREVLRARVLPEFIDAEIRRIMQAVFRA
jgi:hypothetical protein